MKRTLPMVNLPLSAPVTHAEADIHHQPEFPDANRETPVNPAAMQTRKPDNATRSAFGEVSRPKFAGLLSHKTQPATRPAKAHTSRQDYGSKPTC